MDDLVADNPPFRSARARLCRLSQKVDFSACQLCRPRLQIGRPITVMEWRRPNSIKALVSQQIQSNLLKYRRLDLVFRCRSVTDMSAISIYLG
jgi:hypothetical protein